MLSAENIVKRAPGEGAPVDILRGVSLDVAAGDFLTIVGRSGSGKTTLLSVLSTLMAPDEGRLTYTPADGRPLDLGAASPATVNRLRSQDFGVIFQLHYLIPYLTTLENVLLPFMNRLRPVDSSTVATARQALERVGLGGKEGRLPGKLSGGEQQRAAIARALVKDARVLFADEPTGSLDKATGRGVMSLLKDLNAEGLTIVMVTHDPDYAAMGSRSITVDDGRIVA